MQRTSELYQRLLADPLHHKELLVSVNGTEYAMSSIIACATAGGLYSEPGIGNCVSRQIDLQLFASAAIPAGAEIRLCIRLVAGEEASEWLPKGVFYGELPTVDEVTGVVSIHGYDAMMTSEDIWLTSDYEDANWPMSQEDAVLDIAHRMGVELDSRTTLTTMFPVDYPVDENGDLTMRQVLSYIAVSNAGNWIITDAGALRLISYGSLPAETSYLVDEYGKPITFGGVRILV